MCPVVGFACKTYNETHFYLIGADSDFAGGISIDNVSTTPVRKSPCSGDGVLDVGEECESGIPCLSRNKPCQEMIRNDATAAPRSICRPARSFQLTKSAWICGAWGRWRVSGGDRSCLPAGALARCEKPQGGRIEHIVGTWRLLSWPPLATHEELWKTSRRPRGTSRSFAPKFC